MIEKRFRREIFPREFLCLANRFDFVQINLETKMAASGKSQWNYTPVIAFSPGMWMLKFWAFWRLKLLMGIREAFGNCWSSQPRLLPSRNCFLPWILIRILCKWLRLRPVEKNEKSLQLHCQKETLTP